MSTSLPNVGRLKDMAMLLVKHRTLLDGISPDSPPGGEVAPGSTRSEDAKALAADLEEMGPTFVKLGQVLSTRADLLPPEYLDALSRLQERVEPIGYDVVERVVSGELGVRVSKAFADFDERPLAAASLGQVHRASMRDGRPVVVKVQRPDIRSQIVTDMDTIEQIASFADSHTEAGRRLGFADMVAEFRLSLQAELDYRREAANLVAIGDIMANHDRIVVPRPVPDYSTSVVLTMDRIEGRSVGSISPLGLMDVDGRALAAALFSAYLDQILVHGLFHADPHPGNVLVTDQGDLALVDLGMVGRIDPDMQNDLIKLLLAISDGQGRKAADIAIGVGRRLDGFDADRFRSSAGDLVAESQVATLGDLQAGAIISDLTRAAAESGLRLPSELTMLGKALLNLDETARKLDPHFDPNQAIRDESSGLMRRKLLQAGRPANVMAAAMEAKEFAEQLPGRVNDLLDALAAGNLTLNVEGIDERDIMRSFQKLANRVTVGTVVAALIIGAALIARVDTSPKLLGYPALATVLFAIAAVGALGLLVSIVLSDLPQRRRRR